MSVIPDNDIKLNLQLNDDGSITANWIILPGMVKQQVEFGEDGKSYLLEVNTDWKGDSYTTKPNQPVGYYRVIIRQTGEHTQLGGDMKKILIPYDFYDNKPLDVPQNIKITAEPTRIGVSFSAVARAKSYDILFDNKDYNVTTLSKTFTGLTPKTTHTIAVRARGSKQTSPYSATQTVKTLPIPPAVPLGVKKKATETSATISWNKVSGAVSYDVLFNGKTYSTTANSKEITGLTAGISYSFQVRARNADVAGAYTDQMTVATPPKPPTSVTATSTGDSVTVSWNKVAGAAGYLIRLNGDEVYGLENVTSTTYDGLKPKTAYTYQVASRSLDGVGSYSAAKTIKTLAKIPDIPGNILGETTENSVTVKWDAVSDATGYDIQFNGSTYGTIAPSRTFTGLRENTEYAYKVRSKNADGVSEYGPEKKVRTTPTAPANPTASSDESSVTVSWAPVTGASSYDLEIDGKVYNVKGTSYKVTGLKPNTSYSYRIRANNADGSSSYSRAKTLKTTSMPPETVKETRSQTSITLKWDSVSGASNYDLLFNGTTYRVTGTSKTISGLTANTSYNYQIRVNSTDGSSSYSPVKTVKTLPNAPAAYPTVKAVAAADAVTLTWNAVPGATEYELYFDGKTYTVTGTSHRVTGLQDDTSYRYRIRSVNEGGYSSYSSYMTVKTLLKAPDVPTDIRLSASSTSVTVSWKYTLKVKSYDLLFNGTVYNTTGTSKTVSGLRPETTYTCKVRAKNDAGTSAYSPAYSVKTLMAPPEMPANVQATAGTDSVTVSWGSVSRATGYRLRFQGETYSVTNTSKTMTGLTPDTDYEYSVCAYNDGGNSAYSAKKTITTIAVGPAVPGNVTAQAGFNSVIVSFPPVAGATDYDITFDGTVYHVSGTDPMAAGRICKVFSGLQPNTEHTYSARANNAEGSSRYSSPGTIRTDIGKKSGLADRASDSAYTDGRISYTGNDPVNAMTGAFLWSCTCLEDYGKDKLHFTIMYDSDRDAFAAMLGAGWTHELNYLLYMDGEYAYFSTPHGAVIPFLKETDASFRAVDGVGAAYTMEQREDASYAVIKRDGTEYVFDSDLVLGRIVENGLVKYRFEKNQTGQITRISGRHGSSLTLNYAGGNLAGVADALGNTVSFTYQAGRLAAVNNPAGKSMSFAYEAGRLSSIADFAGQVYLTNTYDVYGRVIRQNTADRGESTVDYDEENRKTVFTDETGNCISYLYDADGHVTDVELAGAGIHNSYDEYGRLTEQTDALGNSTKMSYDVCGRMDCVTYPDGTREQVFYNDRNLPVRVVNRDGTESRYEYDGNNNLTGVQDERGNSGVYTYDEEDNLITWTDREGHVWSYAYDGAGHLKEAQDPNGNTSLYVHDAIGRLVSYTSPEGRTVSYQYSAAGDLLKMVDADGEVLFNYDENGNRTGITDRRGNSRRLEYNGMGQLSLVTDFMGNAYQFAYDAHGRLAGEKNPLDGEVAYTYDSRGNAAARTDGNGNVTAYAYDAADRLTQITDAAGGSMRYAYDAMGRVKTVTDPLGRQTAYAYDAQGRVISITDALGHSVSNTYDQAGNLLTRTDEDGNVTAYTYDGENRLLTETSAAGTTRYTYDNLGRIIAVESPDGTVQEAAYDADGNLTEANDPENNRTACVYDEAGHLTEVTAPDGGKTLYQYDANGNCTKITDAEGNSRNYVFDANNRITAVTDALGQTTACEYDAAGRMTAVTDARGGRSTLTYDANGNLLTETDPMGGTRSYTYDSLNRMIRSVDEEGHTKSCAYDAAGNMISFTDANDNNWSYDYDALNRMTGVTDQNGDSLTLEYTDTGKIAKVTDKEGAQTTYQYDAMGRLLKMTDASGHSLEFTYDSMGRVLTQTDAGGNVTAYTYSPAGNLASRQDPEGNTVTYTYNAAGQVTKVTDALGGEMTYTRDALGQVTAVTNPAGESVTFTYTPNGQIGTVTDACGNVTAYAYDACGNLVQVTDPLGNITSYEYDAMNRQIKECISADGETTCATIYQYDKRGCMIRMINPVEEERSYTYDGNANLIGVTDEDGNVTTVTYDLNNQPLQMTYHDGRQAAFRYNKRGELVEMQDWNGVMTMERDVLGRLTGVTDHNGRTIGYTYDPAGNRTAIRYPDESVVNYTYDGNHRLIGVTDAEGRGTQYAYDAAGNLLSMTQPGSKASYRYRADGMPSMAKYQTDDGAVMDVDFAYDPMGRLLGLRRQSGVDAPIYNTVYTYDPAGRLLSGTEGTRRETYSYDALGNRTAWKVNNTGKAAYTYDAMNRLTAMVQDGTAYSYTYDKRGNLTEERQGDVPIRQYIYDTANRMVTGRNLLTGAQTDYTYNALNMRIANTITLPGTEAPQIKTTAYVPDFLSATNNDLMAYHDGGSVTKAVYGRTYERLGHTTAAGPLYEMPDLWGSPLYTADAQGNATWRAGHDTWGRVETQSSPETDTDIRFTNYTYDPVIGKYFAQARFYDSAQGRMLSPDPVKRNINPYPYCDNDPVNYNDPTGEIANILVGAGLGGFFGGAAGFIGNAASQLMEGGKFNWRRAAGAAANGAVVGAAKGALVGSGVGVLGAFATDFAAGTIGNALEQRITRGRVDLGESLLSGAGNALSEVLYGTGPIDSLKDAFIRGARTGALMSGLENIADTVGPYGVAGSRLFGKTPNEAMIPEVTKTGRDPKGMCGASDPFDLSSGLGNGRGYRSGRAHGGAGRSQTGAGGFSVGGFVKDVLTGAVVGGLGSAGFYGAGQAVEKLRGSVAGRGKLNEDVFIRYMPDGKQVTDFNYLPGKAGIAIPRRLSVEEMIYLTQEYGIEFAQVYQRGTGLNGRGGRYFIYSGDVRSVNVPVNKDIIIINHTHPSGTAYPSSKDKKLLLLLEQKGSPQRTSEIIPIGNTKTIRFGKEGIKIRKE